LHRTSIVSRHFLYTVVVLLHVCTVRQ